MTIKTIDYDRLTDAEALDILKQDFDPQEVESWEARNHIISAADVLYYADAYGDLEDAILLQGWDKTLPVSAHKALLDSGYDIFEAVNCHDIEKERCACCDADMWPFEIGTGSGYTQREWVDEWGNVTSDMVEYVSDPAGHIWNAMEEPDHAPVLCSACSHDVHYDFPRTLSNSGSVVVHYGETDERSAFSVTGNLIRWDFEAYYDDMTDLWGLPGGEKGLPVALADGSYTEWLADNDWAEVAFDAVKEQGRARTRMKIRTFDREYRRIAEEWAEGEETHPDLDFTYVIEFVSFGKPSFVVPVEHKDELIAEIVDLIDRRI